MTETKRKALQFADTAKFITDELGLKGCVVVAMFEDGRVGISPDGLTGQQVQDALAAGIYINQRDITTNLQRDVAARAVKQ